MFVRLGAGARARAGGDARLPGGVAAVAPREPRRRRGARRREAARPRRRGGALFGKHDSDTKHATKRETHRFARHSGEPRGDARRVSPERRATVLRRKRGGLLFPSRIKRSVRDSRRERHGGRRGSHGGAGGVRFRFGTFKSHRHVRTQTGGFVWHYRTDMRVSVSRDRRALRFSGFGRRRRRRVSVRLRREFRTSAVRRHRGGVRVVVFARDGCVARHVFPVGVQRAGERDVSSFTRSFGTEQSLARLPRRVRRRARLG
mmetsp:Transcript_12903/g.55099  ORF Transcript_12903/g.55099 Transcript_12903/m.55099 type:complete len:260 (+) Transcript_12903:677-1456(+)